jgi:hypothetical protein
MPIKSNLIGIYISEQTPIKNEHTLSLKFKNKS